MRTRGRPDIRLYSTLTIPRGSDAGTTRVPATNLFRERVPGKRGGMTMPYTSVRWTTGPIRAEAVGIGNCSGRCRRDRCRGEYRGSALQRFTFLDESRHVSRHLEMQRAGTCYLRAEVTLIKLHDTGARSIRAVSRIVGGFQIHSPDRHCQLCREVW